MSFKDQLPDWVHNHLRDNLASGEKGHYWDATFAGGHSRTPTLLLTTVGCKTGNRITLPLPCGIDGGNYVIVGSRGGSPTPPGWYYNLQARPEVDVQVVEQKFRARTHTAEGAERERLWRMMAEVYPPYPEYQTRCERQIPVVLEPLAA